MSALYEFDHVVQRYGAREVLHMDALAQIVCRQRIHLAPELFFIDAIGFK